MKGKQEEALVTGSMSDRWMPVHGGPPTLTFTIQDLYASAAVIVSNRGQAPERVCVSVTNKAAIAAAGNASAMKKSDSDDLLAQVTLMTDPQSQLLGSSSKAPQQQPAALSTGYAIVPPDTTVVAGVVSPRGNTRQLPTGLLVQVFKTIVDTSAAAVTLNEAETSSREVNEWLNRRRGSAE